MKSKSTFYRLMKISAVTATAIAAVAVGVLFGQAANDRAPARPSAGASLAAGSTQVQYGEPSRPAVVDQQRTASSNLQAARPANGQFYPSTGIYGAGVVQSSADSNGQSNSPNRQGGVPPTGFPQFPAPQQQPPAGAVAQYPGYQPNPNSVSPFQAPQDAAPQTQNVTTVRMVPDPNNPGQFIQKIETHAINVYGGSVPARLPNATRRDIEIRHLAADLQQLPAEQRSQEKLDELKKRVAEQFEERHQAQVTRLAQVMAEVKRAQEILDRRDDQREEIINRRVAELMGQQDPLQWDYQPSTPTTDPHFPSTSPANWSPQPPISRPSPPATPQTPGDVNSEFPPSGADSLLSPQPNHRLELEEDVSEVDLRDTHSLQNAFDSGNAPPHFDEQRVESEAKRIVAELERRISNDQAIRSSEDQIKAIHAQLLRAKEFDFPSDKERMLQLSKLESQLAAAKRRWDSAFQQLRETLEREKTAVSGALEQLHEAQELEREINSPVRQSDDTLAPPDIDSHEIDVDEAAAPEAPVPPTPPVAPVDSAPASSPDAPSAPVAPTAPIETRS